MQFSTSIIFLVGSLFLAVQSMPETPDWLPIKQECLKKPDFLQFVFQCAEPLSNALIPIANDVGIVFDTTCLSDFTCKDADIPGLLKLVQSFSDDITQALAAICDESHGTSCWHRAMEQAKTCLNLDSATDLDLPELDDIPYDAIFDAADLLCDFNQVDSSCGVKTFDLIIAEQVLLESGQPPCHSSDLNECSHSCKVFLEDVKQGLGCCWADFARVTNKFQESFKDFLPEIESESYWETCGVEEPVTTCDGQDISDEFTDPTNDKDDEEDDDKSTHHGQQNQDSSSSSTTGTIVGIVIAAMLILVVLIVGFVIAIRRHRDRVVYMGLDQRENMSFTAESSDDDDDVDMFDLDDEDGLWDADETV